MPSLQRPGTAAAVSQLATRDSRLSIMPSVQTLKTGISGVRGVVGDSFTPQLVSDFGQAFGTYLGGGRVALGRDTRPSGEMVREALIGALLASGCSVVDLGVVPVPTLQIAIARDEALD